MSTYTLSDIENGVIKIEHGDVVTTAKIKGDWIVTGINSRHGWVWLSAIDQNKSLTQIVSPIKQVLTVVKEGN